MYEFTYIYIYILYSQVPFSEIISTSEARGAVEKWLLQVRIYSTILTYPMHRNYPLTIISPFSGSRCHAYQLEGYH